MLFDKIGLVYNDLRVVYDEKSLVYDEESLVYGQSGDFFRHTATKSYKKSQFDSERIALIRSRRRKNSNCYSRCLVTVSRMPFSLYLLLAGGTTTARLDANKGRKLFHFIVFYFFC